MKVEAELSAEVVEAIAMRAAELVLERLAASGERSEPASPYMTVAEAAEFLRCRRQRVDDLLSQRRLTRFKDGSRTLVSRAELEAYVAGEFVAHALPSGSRARSARAVAR